MYEAHNNNSIGANYNTSNGNIPRQVAAINGHDDATVVSSLPPLTPSTPVPRPEGQPPASLQFGQSCQQNAITTGTRYIVKAIQPQEPDDFESRYCAEIDTRADTICAGKAFQVLHLSGHVVDVGGFHSDLGTLTGVPFAHVATAYDASDGTTYILAVNEALYFGSDWEHSLTSPQQLMDHGIQECDTTPKQYNSGSIHGLYNPISNATIPFALKGCISYITLRLPTERKLQQCDYIELTSDAEWDPYSSCFSEQERPYLLTPTRSIQQNNQFQFATSSMDCCSSVDAPTLARRWGITIDSATNTLRATTQRGIRYFEQPFTHRFRTRQAQLGHNHLCMAVYSDTLFSNSLSTQGNKCTQIFVANSRIRDMLGFIL